MARILVVDDEPTLAATLDYNLRRAGHEVTVARDGEAALSEARRVGPDLVLLDLMLPKIDGLEVCRILRRTSMVPILMLTARDSEIDKVVGLEIGADDYMTKPFSMRELLARVKAMLRRSVAPADAASPARVLRVGELAIDLDRRTVERAGVQVYLKPREFSLLAFLAQNRGLVLTRAQVLAGAWEDDFAGDARTVDVHVRWLREKLEADPARPRVLQTVRGVGYRLAE